jgi:hypothetical protein
MSFNLAREILDTVFSLSGKYARWLNIKANRTCFIIWGLCCVYWMSRSFYFEMYAIGISSLFSLIMHSYGFYKWRKDKIGEPVNKSDP